MCEVASEEHLQLVEKLRGKGGVGVKNRRQGLTTYHHCFPGSDLVDWLVNHKVVQDRFEGIQYGLKFQKFNLLHHVKDKADFSDTQQLYRFRADDQTKASESVANLTGCDTKAGYLLVKGLLFWNRNFFLLNHSEQKLYCFHTKLDSKPYQILDLTCAETTINDLGDCKAGHYCFGIISCKQKVVLCAENSTDQEDWIRSISDAGATIKEELSPADTKATLFEYSALDIDMKETALSNFAGQVCLVVNVASA